ncbi:MAG: hypothetical protein WC421_05045 [Elusimicrobiales bacterium]
MNIAAVQRIIPLAAVLALGAAMVYFSRPITDTGEAAAIEKIEEPPEVRDYQLPPGMRNIFEYMVVEVEISTATRQAKIVKNELAGLSVNGIVWSRTSPMVSINGVLLTEGRVFKNLKVLKIYPDRVRLDLNGKIIERRMPRKAVPGEQRPAE